MKHKSAVGGNFLICVFIRSAEISVGAILVVVCLDGGGVGEGVVLC